MKQGVIRRESYRDYLVTGAKEREDVVKLALYLSFQKFVPIWIFLFSEKRGRFCSLSLSLLNFAKL